MEDKIKCYIPSKVLKILRFIHNFIMNNIRFIEFTYGKIRYIFNSVLKRELIYLVHVLFYFK